MPKRSLSMPQSGDQPAGASGCCLREAFRMFRSDGIAELRLAGTSFRPRRVVLLRDYLAELRMREAGET